MNDKKKFKPKYGGATTMGARRNHVSKNRKTQKLDRFSEGEMDWFQFSFKNTLKKALKKLCT